ncbi:hypothetical protein EJB05_25852, partial [Eragrostis curvula]
MVNMWIAHGFVKTSHETEELEDVGQLYFDELLTFSFLQCGDPIIYSQNHFTIHDLLHELAERVAGSDYFRIDVNGFDPRSGISPEVCHLFIQTYDTADTIGKIPELENLRTLIIEEEFRREEHTSFDGVLSHELVEEKLFDGIFRKMRKLRVLTVGIKLYRQNQGLSISDSIGQMKHLRFLCFTGISKGAWLPSIKLLFPSTFNTLYHMQILQFGFCFKVSFPEDIASINLIHLRMLGRDFDFPYIGRLTSLRWIPHFHVRKEQGYELKQLKHLNSLRGDLEILGLENVGSKDEALEANIAGKKRLTGLFLNFKNSCNPDVEADVLEGLLPRKDLEKLVLRHYRGPWYPDAPKNLGELFLFRCSRLVYIPEGSELFAGLRSLGISQCTWDALPDHMERLTSLKDLRIISCDEMELLPALPQSLENIRIKGPNMLSESFQDEAHVNRQRIEHVPCKKINPPITNYGIKYEGW